MWVVHFTDKNGKATGLSAKAAMPRSKACAGWAALLVVHYISGPNGARIELKDILEWCSQQARNVG